MTSSSEPHNPRRALIAYVAKFTSFKDQLMSDLKEDDQIFRDIRHASDEEIVEVAKHAPQLIRFMAGYITLASSAEVAQAALDQTEGAA